MDCSDDEDDVPRLSAHTLEALQEFYTEQRDSLTSGPAHDKFAVGAVEEDWQLSQFWYNDETALRLAKEAIEASGKNGRIACVSSPTVYQKLKGLVGEDVTVYLLEYDRRFSVYGDEFIFYDYNQPLVLPQRLQQHSFDLVLADPPYLSDECLHKTAETIQFLCKGRILLCTGAVMEDLVTQILGLKMCKFIPKHNRSLANEFRCFANYETGLDAAT